MTRGTVNGVQRAARFVVPVRARDGGDRPVGFGFLAGIVLGAIIGALLARFFASREDEDEIPEVPIAANDAIVLQERPGRAASAGEAPIALPLATEAKAAPSAANDEAATLPASEAEPDVIPARQGAASPGMVEPVDGACPASHPIKGNHGSGGEFIYHLPEGRLYERTNAEVCFATEADAEAAGYRASKV